MREKFLQFLISFNNSIIITHKKINFEFLHTINFLVNINSISILFYKRICPINFFCLIYLGKFLYISFIKDRIFFTKRKSNFINIFQSVLFFKTLAFRTVISFFFFCLLFFLSIFKETQFT